MKTYCSVEDLFLDLKVVGFLISKSLYCMQVIISYELLEKSVLPRISCPQREILRVFYHFCGGQTIVFIVTWLVFTPSDPPNAISVLTNSVVGPSKKFPKFIVESKI